MAPTESYAEEWSRRFVGHNAEVWIHKKCLKEMAHFRPKDRAKIEATMEKMYCAMEQLDQIPKERLNRNEGRHGKANLMVQAFKSFQARVYGVQGSYNGTRTFFATVAAVKKTDKADPVVLTQAVARLDSLAGFAGVKV